MCNYKNNNFNLSENIRIDGNINDFKLLINEQIVLEHCCNFSYITNKILATKSKDSVYIFSTKDLEKEADITILATFKLNVPNAYAKIVIDEKTYIIDANCQITFSNSNKIY